MVRVLLPLIVAASVLTGCGKSLPPSAQVRGTVTVDNKPLPDGKIFFVTPGKPPDILPIQNGTFEGKVEVGERRVEIVAYKDAPPPPPMEGVTFEPSKMNYLPAKYNTESTLKETVTAQGPNEFKFALKSN